MTDDFKDLCALIGPLTRGGGAPPRPTERWRAILDLAATHGVRPLLIDTLFRSSRDLDPSVSEAIDLFRSAHLARTMRAVSRQLAIDAALRAAGVDYLTFKGVTLAARLYGDAAMREFNDIDILVRGEDIAAAEASLAAINYVARGGDADFRAAFLGYHNQFIFDDPLHGVSVDLHREFVGAGSPFPIRAADAWRNRSTMHVQGASLPILGDEDLLVYLAGHGAKEGWKSLGWICDFAHLAVELVNTDWQAIYERCLRERCGRALLVSLSLVDACFSVTLDRRLIAVAFKDDKARKQVSAILARLPQQSHLLIGEERWAALNMCETPLQKLAVVTRYGVTRTTGDYAFIRLPKPLWSLYYFIRPVRLIIQSLGGLIRR